MRRCWTVSIATCAAWILFCALAGADDNYVHRYTGFTFPPQVGEFNRGRITPYNSEQSDIQVDYITKPVTCLISSYVYPASGDLRDHYAKCKEDVIEVHPQAKLIGEDPLHFKKNGIVYDGLGAVYTFTDKFGEAGEQELTSRLLLFRFGHYWALYRISYPKASAPDVEKKVDDFLDRFVWPVEKPATP